MRDRPRFMKWSRKTGGVKVCQRCQHRHKPVIRIRGSPQRPKVCVKCGAELPSELTYPKKKSRVKWFVREFDPATGETKDHACRSSEDGDELIRRRQRDYTPDAIQQKLIEYTSTLARQIQADNHEDAINQLVRKLGGDPVSRTLKQIGLRQAIDEVCDELRDKDMRTERYIIDFRRAMEDFIAITDISDWRDTDPEMIKRFSRALASGDWQRDGRRTAAVGGSTINRMLAMTRSSVSRAIQNSWVHPRVLDDANASIWSQAVEAVEHDYLPGADFQALVEGTGDDRWMRTFVITAYNSAARRSDLLRLKWRDVDFDGTRSESGRNGPTIKIANSKSNRRQNRKRPLYIPLYEPTVAALRDLQRSPIALQHIRTPLADRELCVDADRHACDDEYVFAVRGFAHPEIVVNKRFAEPCVQAGLTNAEKKNRWSLHDLRRKANEDIQRAGGSIPEQMALTGHSSAQVNVMHHQSADPDRMRALIGAMSGFKGLRLVRDSA